jgi:hypothetical protein
MEKTLKLTSAELAKYESYLDDLYQEFRVTEKEVDQPYDVTKVENGYRFVLDNDFAEFAKDAEHGCTASPDDGCSFCYFLQELGILPSYDDYESEEL